MSAQECMTELLCLSLVLGRTWEITVGSLPPLPHVPHVEQFPEATELGSAPPPTVRRKTTFVFLSCSLGILLDDNPAHAESGCSDEELSSGSLL